MKKPESKPLNDFLGMVDEAHPELQRTAIQIGTGDDGEPLGIIVWEAHNEKREKQDAKHGFGRKRRGNKRLHR